MEEETNMMKKLFKTLLFFCKPFVMAAKLFGILFIEPMQNSYWIQVKNEYASKKQTRLGLDGVLY